ncbi:alpha-protein kinase 3 [Centroberyx affinis]|uniref:alpha-protein kinase 3 n=1 Tax=Centroberyx affinis TaxID=166261 RepID=UPI003A5B9BC2
MTSRRPMTRSFSGNGRTSSFGEEEGSSSNGRPETRNTYLSNVRPENRYSHYRPTRSTLCSVMAQLTEDIQPSFETTLKSKAVSENCNVKFTCVVSGYPAPELTWYKDDMEMDRYCGLPKYEIRRNGKTHTLHIYNCTLDDAAIYQASASNSKGIVSCSGVLEVGTMNEYKIHQRFFAKLKQKAENKRRELEESKKKGKERVQQEQPRGSPDRTQRKRPIPPPEESPVVQELEGAAALEPNGVSPEVRETAPATATDNDVEKVETATTKSPSKETLAKKKIKISNGVDAGVSSSSSSSSNSRSHTMGNGGENSYDGGLGLAQFLAETLHSQAAEEKQISSRVEKPTEMDTSIASANKEKEREQERKQKEREEREREEALAEECEREKRREEELAIEREKDRERQSEPSHKTGHTKHSSDVKHHSKAHKDHDHHNIQASISSVLHTVKDFFFGKGKKDSHDHREKEEREDDHPLAPTPPQFRQQPEHNPEVCKPLTEEVVPMEMDRPKEPSVIVNKEQQPVSLEPLTPHEHSVLYTVDLPPAHKLPPESVADSMELKAEKADEAAEAMEVSVEVESSRPSEEISMSGRPVLTEATEKDSQAVPVIQVVPVLQQEPTFLVLLPEPNHQATKDETQPSPREDVSVLPQTQAPCEEKHSPTSSFTSLGDSWAPPPTVISPVDSQGLDEVPTDILQEKEVHVDKMGKESDTQEGCSPDYLCKEEKAEVKSKIEPCPDRDRSEVTELITPSLEERTETYDLKTPNQVFSKLSTTTAHTVGKDHLKAEIQCTPLVQEMNVEFPTTDAPESLENGGLKILQECAPPVEESIENRDLSAKDSPNSKEEGSVLKEAFTSAFEKNLEVNSLNSLKIQEHGFSQGESTEEWSGSLQRSEMPTISIEKEFGMETEKVTHMKVEKVDESNSHSETHNEGSSVSVSEEPTTVANLEGSERHLGGLTENVPEIQMSTIEDIPEIKLTVPEVRLNEQIIIPKIEVMEPEIKECNLPLTILALNKPESDSAILQKDDATDVSDVTIQEHSAADSPMSGSLPTQKSMLNDDNLPTEKQDQTPKVHLFVVPPISVIGDESPPELKLPTQNERTGTETLAAMLRGTKYDLENNTSIKPEKTLSTKQNLEEMAQRIIGNTPSMLYEALTPEVTTSVLSLSKTTEDNIVPEPLKTKPLKEARTEPYMAVDDLQRDKSSVEKLGFKTSTHTTLSPASLRRFLSKAAPGSDTQPVMAVPAITVCDSQSDKTGEELSGGSTPTSSLSCESSPRLKRRDSLSLIRSATPEELASGARRKIFIPKTKGEDGEGVAVGAGVLDTQGKKETPYMSPSQARRAALLQAPTGQNTPPMERRSPLLSRRKATLEVPKVVEETPTEEPANAKPEEKPAEKEKLDPFKAPQVIRKIRGEPFPDASGHLKLWCQFFNVLSDSTIKWYRDEEEILEVKRSGGDESQVALAIVQASSQDCGVYGCSIKNEYGTDVTDFLLSVDILSEILLRDDLEVGEEIEMTPLLFNKGLGDTGCWGDKFFGRIMTEASNIGEGCAHKASRVKVIYGLDPVFESGSNCIIKVQSPIAYGTKEESNLVERNLEITKQECKIQNMIREYCKIFAAEARVIDNFGFSLEVNPQYLMYRPANSVPYATVEADLNGVFLKYCMMDAKGRLITRTISEVEQKCCAFQHWIHQWTHGNLLVTRLEGVGAKLTNVKVVTKSKGYQGLTEHGSPQVFEQFLAHHQCNYYCGLLGLRPLKTMDSLQQPTKIKGSRSPLLNRKLGTGSSSPQLQRKGTNSPQMSRKATSSPKVTRKAQETEDNKSGAKPKPAETLDVVQMR